MSPLIFLYACRGPACRLITGSINASHPALKSTERHHCVLLSLEMTHFQHWNASSYVVVSQTPRAFCWKSVTGKSHVSWREKLKFVTLQLLPSYLFVTCLVEHYLTECCFLSEGWALCKNSTLQKQHVTDCPPMILSPLPIGTEVLPPCTPAAACEPCWMSAEACAESMGIYCSTPN